jgi:outer membrane protein assembly factor BamA
MQEILKIHKKEKNDMTEVKKRKLVKLTGILLILVLLTCYGISGTIAKYTKTITGSASAARVAKFDVDLEAHLFDSILDSDGSAETDVDDDLIAPGTRGVFTVEVTNDSEVTVDYVLTLAETNAGSIPIEYSLKSDFSTALNASSFSVDSASSSTDDYDALAMGGDSETITIYWRWAFYKNGTQDAADTVLGEAGTATVSIVPTVVFTQVD